VAFVNRSSGDVELVFQHQCLGLEPSQMFDIVVQNARGERAALEQARPPAGMIGSLGKQCEFPFFRATLPPQGKISTRVPFEVASETPFGPRGTEGGPLAPGTYSVEVKGPLVRRPPLAGSFSLVVVRK
jgi:hypothetical protein